MATKKTKSKAQPTWGQPGFMFSQQNTAPVSPVSATQVAAPKPVRVNYAPADLIGYATTASVGQDGAYVRSEDREKSVKDSQELVAGNPAVQGGLDGLVLRGRQLIQDAVDSVKPMSLDQYLLTQADLVAEARKEIATGDGKFSVEFSSTYTEPEVSHEVTVGRGPLGLGKHIGLTRKERVVDSEAETVVDKLDVSGETIDVKKSVEDVVFQYELVDHMRTNDEMGPIVASKDSGKLSEIVAKLAEGYLSATSGDALETAREAARAKAEAAVAEMLDRASSGVAAMTETAVPMAVLGGMKKSEKHFESEAKRAKYAKVFDSYERVGAEVVELSGQLDDLKARTGYLTHLSGVYEVSFSQATSKAIPEADARKLAAAALSAEEGRLAATDIDYQTMFGGKKFKQDKVAEELTATRDATKKAQLTYNAAVTTQYQLGKQLETIQPLMESLGQEVGAARTAYADKIRSMSMEMKSYKPVKVSA